MSLIGKIAVAHLVTVGLLMVVSYVVTSGCAPGTVSVHTLSSCVRLDEGQIEVFSGLDVVFEVLTWPGRVLVSLPTAGQRPPPDPSVLNITASVLISAYMWGLAGEGLSLIPKAIAWYFR